MNIKRMYHDLQATSVILNILDSFLTALTVFSIGYFLIYFYRINYIVAIVIAMLFFMRSLVKKIKENKILLLEKKHPDLRERLRTSYDYQEISNPIIDDLHKDIVKIMRQVDVNAFLNAGALFLKGILICGLLFGTFYMSSIGYDVLDVTKAITNSRIYRTTADFAKDLFQEDREETTNRPLLDNPSLIGLGDEQLNLSLETMSTELDITEITDTGKNDFGGKYPIEIAGYAQETYEEKIPEEHKDVVKEYFKKINE